MRSVADLVLPNVLVHISGNGDPEEVKSNLADLAGILKLQGLNVLSVDVQELHFEVHPQPSDTLYFRPNGDPI